MLDSNYGCKDEGNDVVTVVGESDGCDGENGCEGVMVGKMM